MKEHVLQDGAEKAGAWLIGLGAGTEIFGFNISGYEWVNAFATIAGVLILAYKVYQNVQLNRERFEWDKERHAAENGDSK